ncbi:YSIRK-type signal peptide-containing protein, partial [Streptococcus mitis]|uniref:YSIRK-type signal peptide-containing protein n=1 Tax=Streptococcus mitis TaxID=28037 RepID=UPI0021B81881
MFGKKRDDNGEKLYRYSIRKYHFGAASVAIAALIFFANGVAKADMPVSPATANTEKVGVAVTGLTEGVPPTEEHSEKSQEVGSEKEAITKKSVDKSALNQALSDLQAEIAKIDNGKLSSLASQISQLTDESKRLLGDENTSEEAVATLVGRVQAMTEQVRQLQSKNDNKPANEASAVSKENKEALNATRTSEATLEGNLTLDKPAKVIEGSTVSSKVQDEKELKKTDKSALSVEGTEDGRKSEKAGKEEGTVTKKDKLEALSGYLVRYLDAARKIERPETKKFLEGVEEVVRSVENGLKNPQLTASEIEELMKQGKQAEKKLALAVTREHSGKRDLDNGKKMLPDSYFRAAINRAANGVVYDAQGNNNLTDALVGYITTKGDNSGYPPGTILYISHNDNGSSAGNNNNNLGPQPVKYLKNKVFARVTKNSNGYHWTISYNNGKESRQNPIYYFTVPSGHSVQNMTLKENGSVVKHGGVAQVFNGEADKYLTAVGSPNGGVNGSPYYENVANVNNGIVGDRGGIYTLDDFVKNNTSVYYNRDGMSNEDIRIMDKLYDKIKSSTQNVFAFRPRDFDAGNTYEVEFDTKADTEAPLYYIAGMKSYEKIPSGRFMHKSYQQWYGVQERYNVTVNTNVLKTTFLKGTGVGTLDTASGLMSNAVTIEDTYNNNTQTNPGRGDVTDYRTYKPTGDFSADYLKNLHNRFSRQRSEDGVNTTADRTKGNHTLYIEAKVKGQAINFRLPYKIVTQSDIYQPVAKEVTDTKNYKADLGNADTYIKSYTDVSSQIDGFKTPDADDMETPNPGNSFFKDRISEFPRTSEKIKEQAVKQVQWVDGSSLSTGKRVIELTLDNRKTELFTVPDDIDVLPGGKISKENLEKLKEAIRQQYQKVNTNGQVVGNVPTITETTPVWVKKQVKVTYYDNENNSSTNNQDDSVDYVDVLFKHIQKEAKPAAPTIATPLDGSASVTPNGTTDKLVVSYRPTRQQSDTTLTVKKEGSSWGVVGNRPDGVTVDTSTGRVSITEPTVEDNTKIKAIATYLNSDETSAEDTVKSRDTQAPTVMMNGRPLTERASDNRFVIFRGADFTPTFKVADNSNTIAEFNIKNIPNGVWFNKSGNKDYARTLITNGDYHFSNTKVDDDAPLVTREASVTVRDLSGNAKEYKFEYTIADVMVRNSPKAASLNEKIGDSHNYLIDTLNGSTDQGNKYFPGGMSWEWENANQDTKLTNLGLVRHVAKAVFPTGAQNGTLTANGMTLYAPREIKREVNFNVTDNAKPQATLNGVSLGTTAGTPIFTIFRGATFNPELKAWDNAGKISNVTVSGLPGGVTSTNFPGSQQTGSETSKYTAKLSNGTVNNDYALGEHEATLTVTGSDNRDVSTFKFKYRVVDLDFKNVYETPDAGQQGGKSYVIGLHDGNSVNVKNGTKNINLKDYWKVINDSSKADRGYSYLPDGMVYSINNGGISSNPADVSKGASIAMGHYARMIKADFSQAGDIANNNSTTRTVFAPPIIERRILVAVDPTAPTIDGGADLLYGQAGYKPDIKVKNIVNIGESTSEVGTVNKEATRTIQLYSDQDDTTPIAEHSFDKGSRETEWTFRESDISRKRPNGLIEGETLYARVKVTHRGVSTMSGNSNEKEVTARLNLIENATNRIVQANDSKLNDAEKAAIRIALKKANPTLGLQDENIEISDSGSIVVTKDKKRGWLQTEPNKNRGEGFVTRFADIRKDFLLENIEGAKLPNRDTDKGFAWSNSTSDPSVNGNRSLIYYYDATKGQGINLNDVLRMMHLKPKAGTNSVENPSLVEARGDDKEKAEHNREGYSKDSRTNEFKKGSDYINTLDLVDAGNLSGGQVVSNSPNKLVENGKGTPGAVNTSLQNASIAGANGIQAISLDHVANGSGAIYKAQLYLRPEYVNTNTLSKRNETKDTTTNVINVYFVPIDTENPRVQRSSTNVLGVTKKLYDYLPKNGRPSFTSLVKLTDNYDKDDDTNAKTNTLRSKLNMWLKTGDTKTQIVENGVEKADVIDKLYQDASSTTVYELLAETVDSSGNNSSEGNSDGTSLGFFKTQYPAVTYRKKDNQEVRTYFEIVGQPLTGAIYENGGHIRNPLEAEWYISFDGRKPNRTSISFKDGNLPDRSLRKDIGTRTKTITVTYPNGETAPDKEITITTYGDEIAYENGKNRFETTVGKAFSRDKYKYVRPIDKNVTTNRGVYWNRNGQGSTTPVDNIENKVGVYSGVINTWYLNLRSARGDVATESGHYSDQNLDVNFAVLPQAPTINADAFRGKAGTKPPVTVGNLPTSDQLGTDARVTVELYQGGNKVASKELSRDEVTSGAGSVHFDATNYMSNLTLGEKVHAVVKVAGGSGTTAYNLSSANSNDVQVAPQKPTFDATAVTSTSRTLSGTLGGFDAPNKVVKVHLNDENRTVLSSADGRVTITRDKWTATLPATVKLRQSVAKNGETTTPPAITVENTVTGGTVSTTSDDKEVSMGSYSVTPTIAGSKHIDITVPHDAKRVELRFHNSEENGDKANSIVLVRGQNGGDWHVDAVRTDHTAVSDANKFVAKIENGVSRTNASENLVRIHIKEIEGGSKLHLKEEVANGSGTSTYGKGLGLRVAYQSEAGQDPVTAGNWMISNISNTSPTLEYKGTEGRSDTTRKVFPSGTSITKEKLAELVTIRDTEDNHTVLEDKPYGTGSLQIMSGLTETPGKATPAGRYTVVLKAIDSQGKESNTLTVHVGVVSTDVKYQPQVGGVNLGSAKPITVAGDNHKQTDEVKYTPAETITEAGKVYVLKNKGEQTVHLTDAPQVFNVEYEEKAASTDLHYQPQVGGVNLGSAKPITVAGDNHKQT